ncbi:hypothetical protein D9757_007277 [Collybiopsis confluens]|uniref:Aminoglycoside phosphotransferase domain-containing protein n=1 Tax=Collybiopsis confluens TaxID=2823264 RepID=A0A8H5HGI3_9AGAR|nr:hypothetical protein D9757_007277 [Collybiopsis confluens]
MNARHGHSQWLIYTLLCVAADLLDTVLMYIAPNAQTSLGPQDSALKSMSDEEITKVVEQAPKVHVKYFVRKLTPTTVAKGTRDTEEYTLYPAEANALNLAFEKTTIPVPRVQRVSKYDDRHTIILDYIKGPLLAEVWSTYSIWRKVWVAFILRRYVRQLRQVKASPTAPPGPIAPGARPLTCESPVFGPIQPCRGPFASYGELTSFCNERAFRACLADKLPKDDPRWKEGFDDSEALVLTHQDIIPRNIIVGEDGKLWLIDFGWSGYWPPWFEYISMKAQSENEVNHGMRYEHWDLFIPFICGPYFKQENWWSHAAKAFDWG